MKPHPHLGDQWHLYNIGQGGGSPGADVDAEGAWAITRGSRDVAVAVIDVGVDIGHPALHGCLLPGWSFDTDTDDPTNLASSHGTAAAGIIAASASGGGPTGLALGCRLVPVRIAENHPWERWAEMIAWAASRARILSFALSLPPNELVADAIRRAVQSGVVVCCAAGNRGTVMEGVSFPASMPETIGVGASTNRDERAAYSQFGRGLDLVAPSSGGTLGIETIATRGRGAVARDGQRGDRGRARDWSAAGGTSAATALVAAAAALMLSANPTLRPEEARRILRETARKIPPGDAPYDERGWSPKTGYGRLDAASAVKGARDCPLTDPESTAGTASPCSAPAPRPCGTLGSGSAGGGSGSRAAA